MSALDKEFVAMLQAKIDAAGKLLQEVNSLVEEKGENFLDLTQDYSYDIDDDEEPIATLNLDEVINALDNGGWSTSSMSC